MASPAAFSLMDAAIVAASASSFPNVASAVSVQVKDASKRKRVNRNAKLKQCKLDARREQWLSQVKHGKADQREIHSHIHLQDRHGKEDPGELVNPENHVDASFGVEEVHRKSSEKMDRVLSRSSLQIHQTDSREDQDFGKPNVDCLSCVSDVSEAGSSPKSCDFESPKSKLTKWGKDCMVETNLSDLHKEECTRKNFCRDPSERVGENDVLTVTSKTDRINKPDCLGVVNVSPKNNDDALECVEDDWEAAADALGLSVTPEIQTSVRLERMSVAEDPKSTPASDSKPKRSILRSVSSRAWTPDDALRPSSLPTLSKQQSFPGYQKQQQQQSFQSLNQESNSPPSLCPICAEELDNTDASFVPCTCGFRLCLFCHHRIASDDGRCPGCRKFYNSTPVNSASLS